MQNVITPAEIKIRDVVQTRFILSPSNFRTVSIRRKNQAKVSEFLLKDYPFNTGEEPGSFTYVKKSKISFLRNSCIDKLNFMFIPHKLIYLNPNYDFNNMVNDLDVLLCKDANIGDTCLYIHDSEDDTVFSSGILRLNFKEEKYKYYCFAFFKDSYFLEQLDAKTPKGSTIRHSGGAFLDCFLPRLNPDEGWVFDVFESLTKNVAYSEKVCYEKYNEVFEIIDRELTSHQTQYENPNINLITEEMRADAGIHSKAVYDFFESIKNYKFGASSLDTFGFNLKRGPNLAKRDLGRSIQVNEYRTGYKLLVYPSDISEGGYILNMSYLGARNPVWFLSNKNILFAAEGTVGKTFIICDESLKFTTNFHGIIIYPKNPQVSLKKSVSLGLFLNYMRVKGIFEKLAVGGQGGSFAVGYWDKILIPKFPDGVTDRLVNMYHNQRHLNPIVFDLNEIKSSGIFELNQFRIICNELLRAIVRDIKNDNLREKGYYLSLFFNS